MMTMTMAMAASNAAFAALAAAATVLLVASPRIAGAGNLSATLHCVARCLSKYNLLVFC